MTFFFQTLGLLKNEIGLFLQFISDAIKQGVNDNTGRGISLINKMKLILGLIVVLDLNSIKKIFDFYLTIKKQNYRKALFLDLILVLIHQKLIKIYGTKFSSVFLNAGAHIQHHYFFNSIVINKKFAKNPSWYIKEDYDQLLKPLFSMIR